MTYYNHSLWCTSALFIIAVIVTLGATGVPLSVHAKEISQAGEIALTKDDKRKIKIRKEDENNLRKQDKSYNKQADALVNKYKQTARLVASQGGTPEDIDALLNAADYFEQSKLK